MKSEPVHVNNQLLSNISAAIADEPTYSNITPFSASSEANAVTTNHSSDEQLNDEQMSDDSEGVFPEVSDTVTPFVAKEKSAAPAPRNTFWGTGLKGFAVAASVAAVTVVGMNVWQDQNALDAGSNIAVNTAIPNVGVDAFSQQVEGAPLPQVEFVSNTGSYWVSPQTAERVSDEERLNMFLSQHLENSPTASREGLLSYSRLVGYDDQAAE